MIPLRLRLTNFLSHAETDLDFRALHAAVLTGHNGAGKSSILDAITWCLWGVARSAGDSVVRLGEAECAVELVFGLDGVEYTVRRRRSTHKSVATSLEFFAGTVPLTRSGVRETQAAIIAAVRMDYETFVTTAFLAQGKSDVFTASTPKARKELLGEIIGLARYDVLATAARDAMKGAQAKADAIDASQARLRESLAAIGPATEHLAEADASGRTLALARKDAEDCHAVLVAKDAEVRAAQAEADRHSAARAEADALAGASSVLLGRASASIASLTAAAAGVDDARARHAEWQGLGVLEAAARVKADAWQALDRQIADRRNAGMSLVSSLSGALAARTGELAAERRNKVARLEQLQAAQAAAPGLEASSATTAARLAEMADVSAAFEAGRDEGVALAAQRAEAESQFAAFKAAADREHTKILKLAANLAGASDGAPCPTCAKPLDAAALDTLRADMAAERDSFAESMDGARKKVTALDQAIALKREECERLRDTLRAREELQRNAATLDAQLAALATQAAEVLTLADDLAAADLPDERSVTLRGEADAAALDTERDTAALSAERDAIGHDVADYAILRTRLAEMSDAPAQWEAAQQALLDLERARADVARLEADLVNHRETARKAAEASLAAQAKASRAADVRADLADAEQAVTRLRDAEREAVNQAAGLRATLARLDQDARELEASAAAWQAAQDTAANYRDLAMAFGRNGIQAQAVESAIPEIEQEANRILSELADNHTRVSLVTQKGLKSGGVAETLDVCIADDAGERPYESYSGGEAFRVNFALRLALSRLLARRSGAPLQMLVIDEGFGTQDESGRTRLLQAINAVAGEFRLILIVTHIRELKDAFNSQIEVTKRDGVSSVRLVA